MDSQPRKEKWDMDTTTLLNRISELEAELERAYTNDNFGCYNRSGAKIKGNQFLAKERRRIDAGELCMITCDVAGMGKLNSAIGELAVNQRIADALAFIRTWRGIEFVSQVNSGDEFAFICSKNDANGIEHRMDVLFKLCGFGGAYTAKVELLADYIESANIGMTIVYENKKALQ